MVRRDASRLLPLCSESTTFISLTMGKLRPRGEGMHQVTWLCPYLQLCLQGSGISLSGVTSWLYYFLAGGP